MAAGVGFTEKTRVSTGIASLDRHLDGLFIGDNVIWYDEAGSLAFVFCLNFIQESQARDKPLIYISFDRSPKTLIEALGPLANYPAMTILDCFTYGKGDGSDVFARFYQKDATPWTGRIIPVQKPSDPEKVADAIYAVHRDLKGDVRLIFESLTGMQDLWEGEEQIRKFYSRSCPRLYELETIAYWIIEKGAHSNRLKAHINQIAQVAIELGLRRGKSTLSIIKAQNRRPDVLDKPEVFWVDGMVVGFEADKPLPQKIELGMRLKSLRMQQGLSQKDLAAKVGVTPSTISQIEGNLIYPSLAALIRMAQVLSVDAGHFFQNESPSERRYVFDGGGQPVPFGGHPKESIKGWSLLPLEASSRIEAYLIEITAGKKLNQHFFGFKGAEFGYLLQGRLDVIVAGKKQSLGANDVIYLSRDIPTGWKNPGDQAARLLWLKIA